MNTYLSLYLIYGQNGVAFLTFVHFFEGILFFFFVLLFLAWKSEGILPSLPPSPA